MSALKVTPTADFSAVLGVGSYRPSRVVPNADVVEAIDSSDEWIQQRSGIKERRWAEPHETITMMSVAAAQQALEQAGIAAADVDCVIVATVSHFLQTPSAASAIAYELGTERAAAFDISAACAGFCHGVSLADNMVRSGSARHVLVIGVERLSDMTDPTDRGTAFIFADGAGAIVVGPSATPGIGPTVWGSDGEKYDLIRSRGPLDPDLTMEGAAVFRWASFEMAKIAKQALDLAGVSADELDCFVPHQANNRITDTMIRAMKLPPGVRVARDIVDMGNTSAASVPLALARMIADGEARSGDTALLIAFGAGLAYAAQVIIVP